MSLAASPGSGRPGEAADICQDLNPAHDELTSTSIGGLVTILVTHGRADVKVATTFMTQVLAQVPEQESVTIRCRDLVRSAAGTDGANVIVQMARDRVVTRFAVEDIHEIVATSLTTILTATYGSSATKEP